MKRLCVFFILAMSLAACTGAPALPAYNCGEGICTKLQVVEPVRFNEPIAVIITVTTEKDIPGLRVSLSHDLDPNVDVAIEGPPDWEKEVQDVVVGRVGVSWGVAAAKAKQPLRFTRTIRFPPMERRVGIIASASILGKGPVATDSLSIYLTRAGGTVYLSGTSIPALLTPPRAITLAATPVPWTPTRTPSPILTPTRLSYP